MKTFLEIEEYAKKHFVPIARKDFVEYFKNLIIENNYTDILEIGSAIGYTTVNLALLENVYVTTIEYNTERYNLCLENIKDFNVEDKVIAIPLGLYILSPCPPLFTIPNLIVVSL